ncbi:MAG: hypothetical protein NUW37_06540 [Planctomycetes bacterium]|nr:hypothetical protein [Planctomycetota bacterium]
MFYDTSAIKSEAQAIYNEFGEYLQSLEPENILVGAEVVIITLDNGLLLCGDECIYYFPNNTFKEIDVNDAAKDEEIYCCKKIDKDGKVYYLRSRGGPEWGRVLLYLLILFQTETIQILARIRNRE